MVKTILLACVFLAYWMAPDFRHPLRYALRAAGIEPRRV